MSPALLPCFSSKVHESVQVLLLATLLTPLPLLGLDVALHKKVGEENQKAHYVDEVSQGDAGGEQGAAGHQQVNGLGVHAQELQHLHAGQVRLPPDVLGVHGEEVVGVHDGVDEAVQHNSEVDVPVVPSVGVQPVEQEDGAVVVHVQERELLPLLAGDDEEGVHEVQDLGHVEQPEHVAHGGAEGVVRVAGDQGIALPPGDDASFKAHVGA
mmetsp:Transcript_11730/g.16333  ORF Transcript_11730/g.16333 Transcript_11730/m.16333 type:complete len:211 (+) Transcript_11730:238-870(+)